MLSFFIPWASESNLSVSKDVLNQSGIFAARTIAIETRDLYLGGGYSPALQSVLSMMFLMALMLFFVAIVQREEIKPKHPQPDI